MCDEEMADWRDFDINTRSYATLGPRPFVFLAGKPAPRLDLLNPLIYPECTQREGPAPDTDIVYRRFYRACAGGPFQYPKRKNVPAPRPFGAAAKPERPLELWDNDGIVNTASMLWPNGKDTLPVKADHMDMRVRAGGE